MKRTSRNTPIPLTAIVGIIAVVTILIGIFFSLRSAGTKREVTILYPYDQSLFPPEIAPTTFIWKDPLSGASKWKIRIDFQDGGKPVIGYADSMAWTPSPAVWESVKKRSLEKKATVTIQGVRRSILGLITGGRPLSEKSCAFSTSADSVNAPIFYRDVPLPFNFAKEKMELIQWRMGDISKSERPPVVLTNLPVCGNCHSFNRDASVLAMDVDSGGDKGAYVITPTEEQIFLTREKLITWNDFRRAQGSVSFGLLAQVSPDGRFVASTVEDRVVFLGKEGNKVEFSQLFFPIKGILAYYDREKKQILPLPGADNPNLVQSNPSWSPDGKYIIFARAPLRDMMKTDKTKNIVLTVAQSVQFLGAEEYLQDASNAPAYPFDLYRIPFNEGKGGKAEPIPGASENGMSNYFAKYSPDGKWIVFCKARSFMLLQPDSRLWIMPADLSGPPREMKYNTGRMNSWHSWSPNSKWIVFSSKEHSPYTELFLKHIDAEGNDSPPVRIGQFSSSDRARNIPEFVNIRQGGIKKITESFVDYYSYVRKGETLEEFKKYDEAMQSYRKSLEMNPNFAETHRKIAYLLVRDQKFEEAQKEFETAKKLEPKDPLTFQNLGEIYLAKKELEKARIEFENCLKMDPRYSSAHIGLGSIYLEQGNKVKAQQSFETAVKLDPDNGDAQFMLGALYMEQKQMDKAEKALKAAQRSEKYDTDPEVFSRLGTIYLFKNDLEHAEEALATAAKLDPGDVGALNNLGIVYLKRNDLDRAEQTFRAVYQMNSENPGVCLMLAQILSRKSKGISEAISLYNKAISLNPTNMQAYMDLANLFAKSGDRANAIQVLEKALEVNPNSRELRAQIEAFKRAR